MDFFSKLGYTCPDNCNPADYIFMEVLNALGDKSEMDFDAMASFVGEWHGVEPGRSHCTYFVNTTACCMALAATRGQVRCCCPFLAEGLLPAQRIARRRSL